MANKKRDSDLFTTLRESGLRKRVARTMAHSAGRGKRGTAPANVPTTIEKLRQAASELERHVGATPKRSEAAKKAARKRNAATRGERAKQAAKSRAKGK